MVAKHHVCISIPRIGVQWKRMRGDKVRRKPEDLRAWQEEVGDVVEEALEMMGVDLDRWDPMGIVVEMCARRYPDGLPDLDNYLKGIVDALTGIAWADDSPAHVSFKAVVGKRSKEDATNIHLFGGLLAASCQAVQTVSLGAPQGPSGPRYDNRNHHGLN